MTANSRGSWLVLVLAAACRATPPAALAIANVAVVDVEHGTVLQDRTVLVRGGRIERVDSGPGTSLPPSTELIDGRGRFLMPGLWDMHVHLAGDDSAAARMLVWGITGARDMGGDLEQIIALRNGIFAHRLRGSRLLIAGPALRGPRSASDSGLEVVRTAQDARRVVDSLATRGVDYIKVHEDLTPATWFAIARAARQRRLPLVGHIPESSRVAQWVAPSSAALGSRGRRPRTVPWRWATGSCATTNAGDTPPRRYGGSSHTPSPCSASLPRRAGAVALDWSTEKMRASLHRRRLRARRDLFCPHAGRVWQ